MQHYLDHVERSRKRLEKIATTLSKPKESVVIIRGTVLKEPSVEKLLIRPESSILACGPSIPVYAGTLEFFKRRVRAGLLDASLRKSISFAIGHFRQSISKEPGFRETHNLVDFLSDKALAAKSASLALLLVQIPGFYDYSREHSENSENGKMGASRAGTEFAYVGNELVPTLLDKDMDGKLVLHYRQFFKISEHLIIMNLTELYQAARNAIRPSAIRETQRFLEKEIHFNPFDQRYFSYDECPLVEGFKTRNLPPHEYRFAIEIEIKMMDLMLDALEKQP